MGRFWVLVIGVAVNAAVCLGQTPTPTTAPGTYNPSAAFVAVGPQGRPLTGATISVTNTNGVPQTVYSSSSGAAFTSTVPSTGIVQFFADDGNYIVSVSGNGVSRVFYVNIPATAGGSGITDINGLNGPEITITSGTSGSDVNIDSIANVVVLNIPSAAVGARGLVDTTTQTFSGAKTFAGILTTSLGLIVNESGNSTGDFRVETDTLTHALFCDASEDSCGINTSNPHLLGATFQIFANTGDVGMWVSGVTGQSAIVASGSGGAGIAALADGANSYAVLAQNLGNGRAAQFARSVNTPTVPVVEISRDFTGITDTNPALKILEDDGVAASTHSFSLVGDSDVEKAYITADGNMYGTFDNTNAVFGFAGDEDSGLGSVIGAPCLMHNGTCILTASTTQVTVTGKMVAQTTTGGAGTSTISGEDTQDLSTTRAGDLTTIRGTTLRVRQSGSTLSSSTASVISAVRETTLGGGAALSGPIIRAADDSSTTGDLLALEKPTNTYKLRVTEAGELTFAGVASDGTGKAVCVKSDGFIGTCTDAVGGGGTCTCA